MYYKSEGTQMSYIIAHLCSESRRSLGRKHTDTSAHSAVFMYREEEQSRAFPFCAPELRTGAAAPQASFDIQAN